MALCPKHNKCVEGTGREACALSAWEGPRGPPGLCLPRATPSPPPAPVMRRTGVRQAPIRTGGAPGMAFRELRATVCPPPPPLRESVR